MNDGLKFFLVLIGSLILIAVLYLGAIIWLATSSMNVPNVQSPNSEIPQKMKDSKS